MLGVVLGVEKQKNARNADKQAISGDVMLGVAGKNVFSFKNVLRMTIHRQQETLRRQ